MGTSVRRLILVAYGLQDLQLSGGPSWIASERYAIDARTEANATRASVRSMVKTLLAERFQLAAHVEQPPPPRGAESGIVPVLPQDSLGPTCGFVNFPGWRLLTAIQDDLGLKLDSRRRVVDVLVIDRIERPSEN